MAKKDKEVTLDINTEGISVNGSEPEVEKEPKIKTDKKIKDKIEKQVRKLDGLLSHLNDVRSEFSELSEKMAATSSVDPKDDSRVTETVEILSAIGTQLYHLTSRMARKHVGKEIEPVDGKKRKSLKK